MQILKIRMFVNNLGCAETAAMITEFARNTVVVILFGTELVHLEADMKTFNENYILFLSIIT